MAKFKVTLERAEPGQPLVEEVVADFFSDVGDWVEFLVRDRGGPPTVRRILRRSDVSRIELLDAPVIDPSLLVDVDPPESDIRVDLNGRRPAEEPSAT
jgi:hypothetical protein